MTDQSILDLPVHQNPISAQRTACAPYNFVPLPETVVRAVDSPDKLPGHDTYADPDYPHSGYFDVTLTTRSSLYVRCGLTRAQYDQQQREGEASRPFREQVKNRPEFFYTVDPSRPVIPASSLRGMLRAVLEIVSYGKVQRVTNKELFYRSLGDPALKVKYTANFVENRGQVQHGGHPRATCYRSRVRAGFLRKEGDSFVIEECEYGRIQRMVIQQLFPGTQLYRGSGPNDPTKRPNWACQQQKIYATLDPEDAHFFPIQYTNAGHPRHPNLYLRYRAVSHVSRTQEPDCRPATLVLAGDMQHKKLEYVFLHTQGRQFHLSREMVNQFNGEDQITQWQEQAFPKDEPGHPLRERPGLLRATAASFDEPIFFLTREDDEDKVLFFGRAQMFRLPYDDNPLELVPAALRQDAEVDYAEALFGYVKGVGVGGRQGEKARSYAGRVAVTDGVWDGTLPIGATSVWLQDEPVVPGILGNPKPTAFQHYLTQDRPNDAGALNHYDSAQTTLRGSKRYWLPQGRRTVADIRAEQPAPHNSTQHTQFKPVGDGITFTFRVYFDNLSDRELGALCWTLHPFGREGQDYCHSLGMAKSLGMGAVTLDATLHLTDRVQRYDSLLNADGDWQSGTADVSQCLSDRATLERYVGPFEQRVLETLRLQDKAQHLYVLERIAMLLRLMEWPGVPRRLLPDLNDRPNNARSMRIELMVDGRRHNEFGRRPVLPDPSQFDQPLTGTLRPAPWAPETRPHDSGNTTMGERLTLRSALPSEPVGEVGTVMELQDQPAILPESEAPPLDPPTEAHAAPRQPVTQEQAPRIGSRVKAIILEVTAKGRVQLQLDIANHEPLTVDVPVGLRMRLGDKLTKGREITVTVKDVDRKANRVTRVDLV